MSSIKGQRFNRIDTVYDSEGMAFTGGLNTNNNEEKTTEYQLSELMNFNISNSGYLMPRPGLKKEEDVTTWIEDFKELIEYKEIYGQFSYVIDDDASNYSKNVLFKNISTDGKYYLSDSALNYDFIELINDGVSFIVYEYDLFYSFGFHGNYGFQIAIDNSGDYITIGNLQTQITDVIGYNYSSQDELVKSNSGDSKSEFVIYISTDGKTKITSRYGNAIGDKFEWQEAGEPYTLYNEPRSIKDVYLAKSGQNLVVNYNGGVLITRLEREGDSVKNKFYDLTSGVSPYSEALNINAITLHGFNLLNPTADTEIADKAGFALNIDGVLKTGLEPDNKTHPFLTSRDLKLDAIVTYTNIHPIEDLVFKWTYTFIGTSYLENNLASELRSNIGENEINKNYAIGNKSVEVNFAQPGVYRFYCTMLTRNEIDENGDMIPDTFVGANRRALIDIEFTSTNKDQPDELMMYQSLKESYVMRRYQSFYVYIGAPRTAFSNTIFFSLPKDPTYIPETFYISLEDEDIIDVLEHNNKLYIFGQHNIYRLEGDGPSSIVFSQSLDNSMKPFSLTRILTGVTLTSRKELASSKDIYIKTNDGIRKLYYTSANVMTYKLISAEVINALDKIEIQEFTDLGGVIYISGKNDVFLYQPLDYSPLYGDGRWLYYYYENSIANFFKDGNDFLAATRDGFISRFDYKNIGVDFDKGIIMKFKTQPNFLGNKTHVKRFKSLFLEITPYVNVTSENKAYESDEELIDYTEEQGLGRIALDVYIDSKHVVTSTKQELVCDDEDLTIPPIMRIGKENNFNVTTRQFTLTKVDANYGSVVKGNLSIEKSAIYSGNTIDSVDYLQELKLAKALGRGIQVELEFEKPFIIKNIGFKYTNKEFKTETKQRITRR